MDRKRLAAEHGRALSDLDAAKRDLLSLPNVLAVGIGIKETAGRFTEELSFRVYVKRKVDVATLGTSAIPPTVRGIKTDVLTPLVLADETSYTVCGNERRTKAKHRPLQGGIAVSTDSTSYGTLGWFARLDSDDSLVLVTNKHVLYDSSDETTTEALKTAQPQLGKVSSCCCCECGSDNVIGETLIGIRNVSPETATSVDVAIAKVDAVVAEEVLFEISNNSTDEVLLVSGTAAAVVGQSVRKIGARSGFTRGSVIHIGDLAAAPADPGGDPGDTFEVFTGQVLVMPDDDESYEVEVDGDCKRAFSNAGDSGSVILNEDDEIVALLYRGDDASGSVKLTVGNNIQNVLDALAAASFPLRFVTSEDGGGERGRMNSAGRVAPLPRRPLPNAPLQPDAEDSTWLELVRDLNRESRLSWLVERHQHEVLDLVNHKRPVTVAWQRHHGPAFVAALARSARVEDYRIPLEIEGVTRRALLLEMERVLLLHGSEELRQDLGRYREDAFFVVEEGTTVSELADRFKARGLIDVVPGLAPRKAS